MKYIIVKFRKNDNISITAVDLNYVECLSMENGKQ